MIEGIILSRSGSFRTDGESYIEDGILCLENDKTRIISATDFASIDSLKVAGTTSEGKSRLAVYCDYDDISEAILFVSDSGTAIREYRMFGEHNTDLLTPVIQSLLTGGEISMVKSVQRGVINFTGTSGNASETTLTATINAVDTTKSLVIFTGAINDNKSAYETYNDVTLELTSPTVITATRGGFNNYNLTVPFQVIEYY